MPKLKPFFSYFGSKWRSIPSYPKPEHQTIIEPFAGGASYALHYPEREVCLIDKDPIICGVWEYLIKATVREILELPDTFENVNDIKAPQEARWLIGFWLNRATTHPGKTPSAWMRTGEHESSFWGLEKRIRIAGQLEYIRHWQIFNNSYDSAPNCAATWFIDPPYQRMGHCYRFSDIDYSHLSGWCKSRRGQVIVCEQEGAEWLPFEPHGKFKANHASRTTSEVIYKK